MAIGRRNNHQYRVAMTALSGVAMLAEGSTPSMGKYASNLRKAVDYLVQMSQPNGLIGFQKDYHYTYGPRLLDAVSFTGVRRRRGSRTTQTNCVMC